MSSEVVDLLLNRVHAYVLKVMKDPKLLHANRAEFQSVMQAWTNLGRLLPGFAKIGANEFAAMLVKQAAKSVHERMAFVAKWLPSYQSHWPPAPQAAKSTTSPSPAGLVEPTPPAANATQAQLAEYQRALGKYNRMFEMYSKIMANSHEMKKALIGNFPR